MAKFKLLINSAYFDYIMGVMSCTFIIVPENKYNPLNYLPLCLSLLIMYYRKKRKRRSN